MQVLQAVSGKTLAEVQLRGGGGGGGRRHQKIQRSEARQGAGCWAMRSVCAGKGRGRAHTHVALQFRACWVPRRLGCGNGCPSGRKGKIEVEVVIEPPSASESSKARVLVSRETEPNSVAIDAVLSCETSLYFASGAAGATEGFLVAPPCGSFPWSREMRKAVSPAVASSTW